MPNGCSKNCCSRSRHSHGEPDSPWSFVVLFAGFICCSVANGCLYSFGVILPELMDYFGESRAKIGTNTIIQCSDPLWVEYCVALFIFSQARGHVKPQTQPHYIHVVLLWKFRYNILRVFHCKKFLLYANYECLSHVFSLSFVIVAVVVVGSVVDVVVVVAVVVFIYLYFFTLMRIRNFALISCSCSWLTWPGNWLSIQSFCLLCF